MKRHTNEEVCGAVLANGKETTCNKVHGNERLCCRCHGPVEGVDTYCGMCRRNKKSSKRGGAQPSTKSKDKGKK